MPFMRPTPALPILLLLSPCRLSGLDLRGAILHTHLVGLVRSPRLTWCHTQDIRCTPKTSVLRTFPGELLRMILPGTWVNSVGCPRSQTDSVNPVAMRAAPMPENLRYIQQFLLGRMRWNP